MKKIPIKLMTIICSEKIQMVLTDQLRPAYMVRPIEGPADVSLYGKAY